jgi:predicted Fe-Mo cluster-binding NifX family protein
MKKRIAVPMAAGHLSLHFGHCEQFAIIDIEDNNVVKEALHNPPEHQPGTYPNFLAQNGVQEVVVGGIGQKAIEIFNHNNIKVHSGVSAQNLQDLLKDYLSNNLSTGDNSCDGGC